MDNSHSPDRIRDQVVGLDGLVAHAHGHGGGGPTSTQDGAHPLAQSASDSGLVPPPPEAVETNVTTVSLGNVTNLRPDFRLRTGTVNRTGDPTDAYRFSLTASRRIRIELRGLSANANLVLYDSSGQVVALSRRAGASIDSIVSTLGSGTYTIRVNAVATGAIDYQLFFGNESVAATRQTAVYLGNLTNMQQVFREQAGTVQATTNRDDYYRFALGQRRTMRFDLRDLSANANLRLVNSSGTLIAQSSRGGTTVDSLLRTLDRGTYYIQVMAAGGGTIDYRLRYGRERPPPPSVNLGNLTNQGTWLERTGRVNRASDREDYYRFTLGGTRAVWVWLNVNRDANLSILNSLGWTVYSSERSGNVSDSILNTLGPGTYYIRVNAEADGDIDYRLFATTDEFIRLGDLSRLTTDVTQTGTVSSTSDTVDVYRFTLADTRTISFQLRNLTADADLRLYDSSGQLVADSTHSGTTAETIFRTLEAGTWFVAVDADDSSLIDYELRYGLGVPGSTVSTAIDQGDLTDVSTVRVLTGEVNRTERPNAYYRFTLTGTRTVRFELRNLTENANLYLLDRIGNRVGRYSRSENSGISDETITWTLGPGIYHIQVNAAASGSNIDYLLRYSNNSAIPGRRRESAFDLRDLTNATNVRTTTGRVNASVNEASLYHRNYYRFTLTDTSTVRIELRNLTQNADLYLLDRIGNRVGRYSSSENGGLSDETITWTLARGTYYIQVEAEANATIDYLLRYSNDSAIRGRRRELAFDLGDLTNAPNVRTTPGRVNASVNETSLYHRNYYQFTLTDTRTVSIELRDLTHNADLYLLDRIGNLATGYPNYSRSENGGLSDETITRTLARGTYYIQVEARANATIDYQLRYRSSTTTSSRAARTATTPGVSQPLWHDDAVATATTLQSEARRLLKNSGGALAA